MDSQNGNLCVKFGLILKVNFRPPTSINLIGTLSVEPEGSNFQDMYLSYLGLYPENVSLVAQSNVPI